MLGRVVRLELEVFGVMGRCLAFDLFEQGVQGFLCVSRGVPASI